MVGEPTKEQAIEILRGLKATYEDFHQVKYDQKAIEAAVHLSSRYINDRFLPDKAIDLLDEAGSRTHLRYSLQSKSPAEVSEESPLINPESLIPVVDAEEIAQIVAAWTGIPVTQLTETESESLLNLEYQLHERIIGQQEAVNAEIERQLMLNAIIPRTNEPLFSSPPEPEMTPQFIMRYFNRVPGEGKFVLHMNEEFFQRLMDALERLDFNRVEEREEVGPFVSNFLEHAESVFHSDDEESKTVDVGGARFKISLFDGDYFDLNLNKAGILMLQAALKIVSRRETLDGSVWNFFKRIRAIVDQQEHGTFDRNRVPFPLHRKVARYA
jgi:hypothetical protein